MPVVFSRVFSSSLRRAMSTSGCPNSARRARRASSSRSFTRMSVPCMKAFVAVPRSPVSLYLPGLENNQLSGYFGDFIEIFLNEIVYFFT